MEQMDIEVINKLGLHARASAKLTQLASKYPCDIFIERRSQKVNAKSIMGVMMLAASQGTMITLECSGDQEKEALEAIQALFLDRFGEPE